jgi:hypothetical protein
MNLKLKPEYAYTCASESTERDVSVEHSEAHGQDKVNNLSNGSTDRDESMEQSHTLGHDEDNTHFEERANDEWKYGDMNEEEFEDVKPEAYTGGKPYFLQTRMLLIGSSDIMCHLHAQRK